MAYDRIGKYGLSVFPY